MFIKQKTIFAVLIALFVFAGFGISNAAIIGGLGSQSGINYVAPTGIGDALIYNYYNARGGNVTYFTVVNTSDVSGVRARVRLREASDVNPNKVCSPEEARGSFEILDFDICLSRNDMWTGFLTKDPLTGGAMLCSIDTDTMIQVSDDSTSAVNGKAFATAFPNCVLTKFGSVGLAGGNITADATLEGYIEIIGERAIAAEPEHCFQSTDVNGGDAPNSLFGNAAIISMTPAGSAFTYDATAIADFASGDIADKIGSAKPDFDSGDNTLTGVNYILAKTNLVSIYDLNNGARTEFIVTLPTKALTQVCGATNDQFDDLTARFFFYDDKEQTQTGEGCNFSPCLETPNDKLPYEVNAILPKTGNSIMAPGTSLSTSIELLPLLANSLAFEFGWFNLDLFAVASHETHFDDPGQGHIGYAYGWPALGLTLMDVGATTTGAFPMQFMVNVDQLIGVTAP